YFGTSKADFYRFNQNAIQASFASEGEKKVLLELLDQQY
ncbi:TPA: adenosine deaminase, partial [Streptococcus suis]